MKVTVFSKTATYCAKCNWTKKALSNRGITYTELALEDQPDEWPEELRSQGMLATPVVRVEYATGGAIEWCDWRPDLIENLANRK